MYLIKEMKSEDRPRERLLTKGANALSNEELLAVLLRCGTKEYSVIELSKSILSHLESFRDLENLTVEELMQIKGVKIAKATTIIAAIELGRRLNSRLINKKKIIKEPKDVYNLMATEVKSLTQENFIAIYLDIKGYILKKETIFIGTLNQTLIHPRELFKTAFKLLAYSVVFIHNHPSGDSSPSKSDVEVTKKIIEIGEMIGIIVQDHIIIGKEEFYSVKNGKKYYVN
ncbi:DNA repair protein RadC [Acholeplasma sp. OttesenSCG-928-E16]|nr:DNA repair protein RadC [Acholeplasma sp. OttesenSCG-928-E16]